MSLERELGEVVGELKGINVQLGDLKEGQKATNDRLQRMAEAFDKRFQRLERASSNWRWLERVGVLIGGGLAGFLGGKGATG